MKEWAGFAAVRNAKLACALHIDTGLNRLGLPPPEVQDLVRDAKTLARLDIKLIMSHLASADDPADLKNEQQRTVFEQLRSLLPKAPASLAASDGLMLGPAYHFDLARPGYALYGGQAFKGGTTPVNPVVRVAGADSANPKRCSGSIRWILGNLDARSARRASPSRRRDTRTDFSARGAIRVRIQVPWLASPARKLPSSAASRWISSPLTSRTSDPAPLRGDLVDLVGPGLTIESMGAHAGTIGYEVLTSLSRRFQRVYVGDASA